LTRVKWIATHHGWIATDKKLAFYEKIDSFILKYAPKIVFVSSKMKQKFLNKNIKEGHLEVIDNGIPIEKFDGRAQRQSTRSSLGLRDDDCAIVIVGRLSREKGHEIFLKAAVEVLKNTQHVKFIIVGDGPLRKKLEQEICDLNLSGRILFTGIREDMPAIYAACDILVNSSHSEGLPMTILEAMASRLPVIATQVGAVGEVIRSQENGILLQPGDEHQLALGMMALARDNEKCRRFAEIAYQDVCARFSDTGMARKYKQVYEEVLFQ